jgi:hypothetical protein
MNKSRKIALVLIITAAAGYFTLLGFSNVRNAMDIGNHCRFCFEPKQSFDSTIWKESDEGLEQRRRVKMVDDLLVKHQLIGMTTTDIIKLLGIPTATDATTDDFPGFNYAYYLGPEREFPWFDSVYLCLKLRNGKAIGVSIQKPVRSGD